LLNRSELGGDAGVSHNTVQSWISVLEAGYIVSLLRPFFANVSKRLVKSPKLHFTDSGLLCHLLGIRSPDQLRNHPHRGAIFESWVVSEVRKGTLNQGAKADLSFYREGKGAEVDLVIRTADRLMAVEIKSGQTVASDFFAPLRGFAATVEGVADLSEPELVLVYGGDRRQKRSDVRVVPWSDVGRAKWV
jgi:predicted AAA+ superfamily ATPase